jgi:hypothetical protein
MLSMIGHPSGDEPLMMDVRQSGPGPDMSSYRNSGKGYAAIVGKVE